MFIPIEITLTKLFTIIGASALLVFLLVSRIRGRHMNMFTSPFLIFEFQDNISRQLFNIIETYEDNAEYLQSIMVDLDDIAYRVYEVSLVKVESRKLAKDFLYHTEMKKIQKLLYVKYFCDKIESGYFFDASIKSVAKYVETYTSDTSQHLKDSGIFG